MIILGLVFDVEPVLPVVPTIVLVIACCLSPPSLALLLRRWALGFHLGINNLLGLHWVHLEQQSWWNFAQNLGGGGDSVLAILSLTLPTSCLSTSHPVYMIMLGVQYLLRLLHTGTFKLGLPCWALSLWLLLLLRMLSLLLHLHSVVVTVTMPSLSIIVPQSLV